MSAPDAIAIRPAGPEDAEAIAALHAASWRSAYRGILADSYLEGPMEAERLAVWRGRFAGPVDPDQVVTLAVAEGGGDPLAFACILYGQDPVWGSLIDNLHVRPDLKRLRLGRRVLASAVRLVPHRHRDTPLHLTVFEDNSRAVAAYESWGGRLAERVEHQEGDGRRHLLRRYAWDNPGTLLQALGERPGER